MTGGARWLKSPVMTWAIVRASFNAGTTAKTRMYRSGAKATQGPTALKKGTAFSSTGTASPVRGITGNRPTWPFDPTIFQMPRRSRLVFSNGLRL